MQRVLLVDDDEGLRRAMLRGLSRAGYEVNEAANGCDALRLHCQRPFHLIITDILMPEKDGIELLAELKKQRLSPRVIAISGGGCLEAQLYLHFANCLGTLRVLAKPFTMEQLVSVVDDVLLDESRVVV